MGPIEFHVVSFMDQGVIRGGRAADATVLDPRRDSSCCDAHPPGRGPRIRLRTNLEPRNTSAPSRAFRRLRQRELPPWRGRIHRDTGGERGEQRRDAVIQQYMSGFLLGPRHGRFPHLRLPREGLLRPDAHQLDAPTRGRAGFRVRLDANYGFRPPRDSVPLIPNPWSPAVHESVPCTVRGDDDFRLGRDLATEPRIHRPDRSGDLPPGRICKRHRDPHEHRARNDCDALRPTVLRAVPRPRRSAPCRIQRIEMVGLCPTLDGRNPRPGPVPKRDVPLESKDGCGEPSRPRFAIRSRPVLPLGLHGSVPAICLPDRCRDVYRGRLHGLESFLDVPQDAIEQRFPVPVYRIAVGAPGPIGMQVPEEAAFRMWLHAKDVPVAVAERGDVEGGPTRVPRISGVLPAVVDEAKHDLIVVDHLLQNPFLAVGGEDRPRPDVIARREPARDHQDVVIIEVATQPRGRVARQLLQVDFLGLRAQMTEIGHRLVLAVRPFDIDDGHADARALHETTTCLGIASAQAFRITGTASEVHCRPRARCNERPPVVPRYVVGMPSIKWVKASYRSLVTSSSHRPFDSEKSCTSHRIGSIAVVFRSAPMSPPRHISAAATARPPWLRSCAAATVPARIARRRWSIDARRPIGSTDGTGAVPPRRRRYSDPPSSACVEPTKTTGSPARLKSDVTHCRRSSTIPTPRTTGVGGHGPRLDSL